MPRKLVTAVVLVVATANTVGLSSVRAQNCPDLGTSGQEICVVLQEVPGGAGPVVLRGASPLAVNGLTIGNYALGSPTTLTFFLRPTITGFALSVAGPIQRTGAAGTTISMVAHAGLIQAPPVPWSGGLLLTGSSTSSGIIQLGGGTGYDIDLNEPGIAPFSRLAYVGPWSPSSFGATEQGIPIALSPVSIVMTLAAKIDEANGIVIVPATVGIGPDGLAPAAPVGEPVSVLFLPVPAEPQLERFSIDQFIISNAGGCSESYYSTVQPSVSSLEGAVITDPDPTGCGFGKVSEVSTSTVDHFTGSTVLAGDFPVPPTKDLVIGGGAVLTVPAGIGLANQGSISIARTGTLEVDGEFLNESGSLNNLGLLDVAGLLLNQQGAEVFNRAGATLADTGIVDNYGYLSNADLIDIDAIFRNWCDATLDNTGTIDGTVTDVDCMGCPGVGSCCQQQATSACADLYCCISVCQQDPDCCAVEWDADCAQVAGSTCSTCDPQGACCTVDPPGCSVGSPGECTGPGETYLGDGVTCFPDWCAVPPGGCCLDGGCVTLPLAECMEAQGQVVTSCAEASACPCDAQPIPLGQGLNLQDSNGWLQVEAGSGGGLVIDACDAPGATIQVFSGAACGELTPLADSAGSCSICLPTNGCGPVTFQLTDPSGAPLDLDLDCYEVDSCAGQTPQASTCNPINVGAGHLTTPQELHEEGNCVELNIEALFANSSPAATHTAVIDEGDGDSHPGMVQEPTSNPLMAGRVTGALCYRDNGTYTVTVTVSDDLGNSNSHSFDVVIANDTPRVELFEDKTVSLGSAVKLGFDANDVALGDPIEPGKIAFFDNGTDNPAAGTVESFDLVVNWGDGTTPQALDESSPLLEVSELELSGGYLSRGLAELVHIYDEPDIYTVTVTVIDDDGGVGTDQVIVHVVAGDCNNDTIPDDEQLSGACVDQKTAQAARAAADLDCEECCCTIQIVADNFSFTEETTVTGVRWWGAFFNTPNEQTVPQNFTVNVREDAAGSPSSVAAPWITFAGVPTGRDSMGFGHYYELVLDTPVELPPGTYWIEIYNDSGSGTAVTFSWDHGTADPGHSLPGSKFAVTHPVETWFDFGVEHLSFQLMCQGANDVLPPGGDDVPDDCSIQDCNDNEQRDADEIVADPSLDCDADSILDECQSACTFGTNTTYSTDDCDCSGVPDFCEAGFTGPDCNANTIPDTCDGCTPFTISLSNSASNNTYFACQAGTTLLVSRDNNYARCWTPAAAGVTQPFEITSVRFAVRTVGPGVLPTEVFDDIPVTVAIHEDDDGCPPILEGIDLIPVVSTEAIISSGDANSLVEVFLPPTLLDPAKDYVVVISVPDLRGISGFLSIGMNNSGASGPTYKRSDSCEEFEYETIQSQGAQANRVLAGLRISGCYPLGNDSDGDGVPNECEDEVIPPAPQAEAGGQAKNRFVSFVVPPASANRGPAAPTALRVTLTTLNHVRRCCSGQDGNGFGTGCNANAPCDNDANCSGGAPLCRHQLAQGPPTFPGMEGNIRYVNSFAGGSLLCADDGPPFNTTYRCATLGCDPEYRDWATDLSVAVSPSAPAGLAYITGDALVPSSTMHIEHIASSCGATPGANTCTSASAALPVGTAAWGDITSAAFGPPDGKADVLDIPAVTNKLKGVTPFFAEYRTWLKQRDPAANTDAITVVDLSDVQDGVLAKPYPASRSIDACPHD